MPSIKGITEGKKGKIPVAMVEAISGDKENAMRSVIDKEVIRRLRIQNKKLLEQVSRQKQELRSNQVRNAHLLDQVNEMLKLLKSNTKA